MGIEKGGEGLGLLLGDEEHNVPLPDGVLREVHHHGGAQGGVHAEVHHPITRQLLLDEGAVRPKGHTAAAHENDPRLLALRL